MGCRKKFEGTVGQQQRKQDEENSVGVKSPRQQTSTEKDGVVIKINRGGGKRNEAALQQKSGDQQQYASGDEQRLQHGFSPEGQIRERDIP